MGTTTPIHDALAQALRELGQDLDLTLEIPVARPDHDPVDTVDDPADHDDPTDHDPAGAPTDGPVTDDADVPEDVPDEPENVAAEPVAEDVDPEDAEPEDVDPEDAEPEDVDPEDVADAEDDVPLAPTVRADAEEVIALAWREADEREHACFGTGHLLLGLVRAGGREAGLLAAVGVTARTAGAAMTLVASSSVSEPVLPAGDYLPVAGAPVAEVLEAAAQSGHVTAAALLTALLARPWGQAAEMLAALGVEPGRLATAATEIAGRPTPDRRVPRPMPRDPSGLLSAAWRRPVAEVAEA